jgi:hypothetical protein
LPPDDGNPKQQWDPGVDWRRREPRSDAYDPWEQGGVGRQRKPDAEEFLASGEEVIFP